MKKKTAKGEDCLVLNAGRGNPNFLNTTVREAYCHLSLFAIELAGSYLENPHLGLRPEKEGIAEKLNTYLEKNGTEESEKFLKEAILYAEKNYNLKPDDFVFELADGALGDFYPSPPRIFPGTEKNHKCLSL